MSDGDTLLPAFDRLPEIAELHEIAAWMTAAGLDTLEFSGCNGTRLRLAVGQSASGTDAARAAAASGQTGILVRAPSVGTLRLAHPMRSAPFVTVGAAVGEGDILALVQVGPLYEPVLASSAGTVVAVLAADAARVGYGAPLFRLDA